MSIDNIFKCCKKNYILTGVSGIFLGAYGSYYGLSNFLGPIYEPPIENPPVDANPVNITPPISEPISVPLGKPVTVGDAFFNGGTIGAVALIGGLAVLTYGTHRFIMSRESYQIFTDMQSALKSEEFLSNEDVIKDLKNKLQNSQKQQFPPKKEDAEKIDENITDEDIEKMKEENLRNREEIRKLLDKIDESKKKSNLAGFNFFGGLKTVTFVKPVIEGTKIFELKEENEKEEIIDLKPRQEIILTANELLLKAEGDVEAIISEKLFKAYEENIDSLGEGRVFEKTNEIVIHKKALIDIFLQFGLTKEVTLKQLLIEDVNLTQQNMALTFARSAYDDLNNFIYYGAKTLVGTPYIAHKPENIIYDIAQMQMIDLPLNQIGYLNAPRAIVLLDISVSRNFSKRLVEQFMKYIIPVFSRLTVVGIARFDEHFAKLLYIVSNNAFGGKGGSKIVTVPKFGEGTFFSQFKDINLLMGIEYNKQFNLTKEEYQFLRENLSKEGLTKFDFENLMKIDRFREEFEHIYNNVLMKMLDKRDAYVDFIKIFANLYKNIHLKEYTQIEKNYNTWIKEF